MSANPIEGPTVPLQLDASTANGRTIVCCSGKLVAATAELFKTEVTRRIERSNILVVDLTGVTCIDSSGSEAIESVYTSVRKGNCEFWLIEAVAARQVARMPRAIRDFEHGRTGIVWVSLRYKHFW